MENAKKMYLTVKEVTYKWMPRTDIINDEEDKTLTETEAIYKEVDGLHNKTVQSGHITGSGTVVPDLVIFSFVLPFLVFGDLTLK